VSGLTEYSEAPYGTCFYLIQHYVTSPYAVRPKSIPASARYTYMSQASSEITLAYPALAEVWTRLAHAGSQLHKSQDQP